MGDVAKRFLGVPPVEIALPAVVLYELEVGRLKSRNPERRRRDLEELTRFATILPLVPQKPQPQLKCAQTWNGSVCQSDPTMS